MREMNCIILTPSGKIRWVSRKESIELVSQGHAKFISRDVWKVKEQKKKLIKLMQTQKEIT